MNEIKLHLKSDSRMSNRQYHAAGKPTWWVRIGSGVNAKFLSIPSIRGDEYLDVRVTVPADTTDVFVGCGPNNKHGVRETFEV